jgi:hypothetical protein
VDDTSVKGTFCCEEKREKGCQRFIFGKESFLHTKKGNTLGTLEPINPNVPFGPNNPKVPFGLRGW